MDKITSINELNSICKNVRIDVIKMTHAAGSGHPGGSLSATELLVALYFNELNIDPSNPSWSGRDFFILSKAHVCPALYSVMARKGFFPVEELMSLRKFGSRLQGHPDMNKLPGLEVSGGSLGQGLSVSVGIALGLRKDGKNNRVYCMLGDGELQEGQVWEAIMSAGHYKLSNLLAIVDRNKLQIDGFTEEVMSLEPLKEKWLSFKWNVLECNGHDLKEVLDAFAKARECVDKPTVIIADTVKGKGVSFMENKAGWHGKAPNDEELKKALEELQ